ncbi:MAG: hypothetical protein LH468_08190 [Nocardioides sp.]|nr:hypothetical protein [Nocardioides sp.]
MSTTTGRRRPRLVPGLWAASALSAVVLALGVSGTLSAWTSAVITNETNTAATAAAVILKETGPDGTAAKTQQTCFSSTGAANIYSCTNINKYGGITAPLAPGTTQTTDVTFSNVGSANASSFVLTAGTCTSTAPTTPGAPTANNLCTTPADLTVALSCSLGGTFNAAAPVTGLVYPAGAPGSLATRTYASGLASGASLTCRFTVAVPSGASVLAQGVTVTQPLTWTLTQ